MKRKILLTGSKGFLGSLLLPALRRDHNVVAGTRTGVPTFDTAVLGDLSEFPNLLETLAGVDCVVHCAARAHILREVADNPLEQFMRNNSDATLHLALQSVLAGVKRFIYISSIGVNGNQTHGRPFRACDKPNPCSPYALSKLEAEKGLAKIANETGLEVVVIRPALIIGPKPVGNIKRLAEMIDKGIPLPFARVSENRRSVITVDSLIELINLCVTHPEAHREVVLAADVEPISTREILEIIAKIENKKLRLLPIPVGILRFGLRALGWHTIATQLLGDLEIDVSATASRLGWEPRKSN